MGTALFILISFLLWQIIEISFYKFPTDFKYGWLFGSVWFLIYVLLLGIIHRPKIKSEGKSCVIHGTKKQDGKSH